MALPRGGGPTASKYTAGDILWTAAHAGWHGAQQVRITNVMQSQYRSTASYDAEIIQGAALGERFRFEEKELTRNFQTAYKRAVKQLDAVVEMHRSTIESTQGYLRDAEALRASLENLLP